VSYERGGRATFGMVEKLVLSSAGKLGLGLMASAEIHAFKQVACVTAAKVFLMRQGHGANGWKHVI